MPSLAFAAVIMTLVTACAATAQPRLRLALIADDPALSVTFDYIRDVRAVGAALGYDVEISAHGGSVVNETTLIQQAITNDVAGLILMPVDEKISLVSVQQATSAGYPVVIVARPLSQGVARAQFRSDEAACATEAAKLISRVSGDSGRLLAIYGPRSDAVFNKRREAMEAVFDATPQLNRAGSLFSNASQGVTSQLVFDFLNVGNEISAIIASSDEQALGALSARNERIDPPDLLIAGIGGSSPLVEAVKANSLAFVMLEPIRAISERAVAELDLAIKGAERTGPEVTELTCAPYMSEATRARLSGEFGN